MNFIVAGDTAAATSFKVTDLSYAPLPIDFAQIVTGPNAGKITADTCVRFCVQSVDASELTVKAAANTKVREHRVNDTILFTFNCK